MFLTSKGIKKLKKTYKAFLVLLLVAVMLAQGTVGAFAQTDSETLIDSSYYQVDRQNGFLRGIAPGTDPAMVEKVCLPAGVRLPGKTVATGAVVELEGSQHSLQLVVTADLNGDGNVTITDLLMLKAALLGNQLADISAAAADVNYDGNVSITDFLKIKSNLLGMEAVTAGRVAKLSSNELILLTPGESRSWNTEAAVWKTSDPAIATVSGGTVTAGAVEGSCYVYACDAQDQVLATATVTVLKEQLQVRIAQKDQRLVPGKTVTLQGQLNHPVQAGLQWTSSDPEIATVADDGTVTAVKPGTVVITAMLANGQTAQTDITVAPPITDLAIERKLYKVKPGATKELALLIEPSADSEIFTWTSSDPSIATVSNGVVTGVGYGTVTITVTGTYSGLSASCQVKVCNVKQVAITFDDGPSNQTTRLLDFLKENDIRVTFFLVGNRMTSFSTNVKREAAEGHEIGYHSYSHAMQTGLSSERITSDFEKSDKILYEMTGKHFTVWRTPGGDYNTRVTNAVPLPHIMWSVDTLDWSNRNTSSVYYSVINNSKDGSIVLMHDLYGTTVDGSIMAMKEMLAGDYEFVTVTELLSRNGTPPQNSATYYRGP